jgi:hypothetical protein
MASDPSNIIFNNMHTAESLSNMYVDNTVDFNSIQVVSSSFETSRRERYEQEHISSPTPLFSIIMGSRGWADEIFIFENLSVFQHDNFLDRRTYACTVAAEKSKTFSFHKERSYIGAAVIVRHERTCEFKSLGKCCVYTKAAGAEAFLPPSTIHSASTSIQEA